MRKTFLRIGTFSALIAVGLGAFGAHTLKELIPPEQLAVYETGVRYQFYHSFALLIVGLLLYQRKTRFLGISGWLFLVGIFLFSGSLYIIAVAKGSNFPLSWIGPLTPIGGLFFMAGWFMLFLSTYQENQRYKKDS